ncbi:MAG: DUF4190 domain-containing protein [Deltaproteobacteria bacterium]|nr:DUF4190 domain-containing protein [Deltaproteobacteria bacterium]
MSESARRLRANKKLENAPCRWCDQALQIGDEAAVCAACEAPHHAACWDGKGGCARTGCANAPLHQLAVPAAAAGPFPGTMRCPHCGAGLAAGVGRCPSCGMVPTPDGEYYGPRQNAPGAVAALVTGIIGLLICGVILGIVAITQSRKASQAIANDPSLGGQGMATAGMVLGIVALVFWAIILLVRLAALGGR